MDFFTKVMIRHWVWIIIDALSLASSIIFIILYIRERTLILMIGSILSIIIYYVSNRKVKWYEEREIYATNKAVEYAKRKGYLK